MSSPPPSVSQNPTATSLNRGSRTRSRAFWLALAAAVLTLSTILAFTQSPRPAAEQAAASGIGAWLLYPTERNAPVQRIDCDLNAVYALDTQNVWAVGNLGLIVHTEDGGRTWTQQRLSATTTPTASPAAQAPPANVNANENTNTTTTTNVNPPNSNTSGATPTSTPRRAPPSASRNHASNLNANSLNHNTPEEFAHAMQLPAPQNINRKQDAKASGVSDQTPPEPTPGTRAYNINTRPANTNKRPRSTPRRVVRPAAGGTNNAANANATPAPTATATPTSTPVAATTPAASSSPQATPTPEDLIALVCISKQECSVVNRRGAGRATVDSGQHWGLELNEIAVFSSPIASFSTEGTIIKTNGNLYCLTTRGLLLPSNSLIPSEVSERLIQAKGYLSFSPVTAPTGSTGSVETNTLVVGYGGAIYRSTFDGPWVPLNSNTNEDLRGIAIAYEPGGLIWVVGSGGTILRSTDNGATWSPQTSGIDKQLNGVSFLADGQHGWAVGNDGTILATADGGAHWVREAAGTREVLVTGAYGWLPAGWYFLSWLVAGLCLVPVLRRPVDAPPVEESVADVLVSDRPLEVGDADPLQFRGVALGLSRFLRNEKTRPPLTIAVTGEWGTGKSSLMNLLRADLRSYGFRPVWFNAWHHQKEEHILAALLQNVRLQAVPRWWRPVGLAFRARLLGIRGWRHLLPVLALLFVAAALASYAAARFYDGNTTAADPFQLLTGFLDFKPGDPAQTAPRLALLVSVASVLAAVWKGATAFGVNPASLLASVSTGLKLRDLDAQTSFRKRFADEFNDVTRALGDRSMIIFIDDLDRCRPENVLETLEAVNFLVSSGECFVVIGMARERVERCVGLSFKDVAEEVLSHARVDESAGANGGANGQPAAAAVAAPRPAAEAEAQHRREDEARRKRAEFARQYLDKLINIEVPVPRLTTKQAGDLLIAARMPSPPAWLLHLRRARATSLKVWPALLAALVLGAGVYAGVAFHSRLGGIARPKDKSADADAQTGERAADTQAASAAANRSDAPGATGPANAETSSRQETTSRAEATARPAAAPATTATPARADIEAREIERRRQTQTATLTPHETTRRPAHAYWPLLVVLLLAGAVAAWLLTRRPGLVVRDSPQFEAALRIWHPVVFAAQPTPRAIKRFMNRVRYLAMRQRAPAESRSLWERITDRLARRFGFELPPAPQTDAPAAHIPEAALVALAALQQLDPLLLQTNPPPVESLPGPNKAVAPALAQAELEHERQFVAPADDYRAFRNAFLKMSADIRVN